VRLRGSKQTRGAAVSQCLADGYENGYRRSPVGPCGFAKKFTSRVLVLTHITEYLITGVANTIHFVLAYKLGIIMAC